VVGQERRKGAQVRGKKEDEKGGTPESIGGRGVKDAFQTKKEQKNATTTLCSREKTFTNKNTNIKGGVGALKKKVQARSSAKSPPNSVKPIHEKPRPRHGEERGLKGPSMSQHPREVQHSRTDDLSPGESWSCDCTRNKKGSQRKKKYHRPYRACAFFTSKRRSSAKGGEKEKRLVLSGKRRVGVLRTAAMGR